MLKKTAFRLFSIIIIHSYYFIIALLFIIRSDFNKEETIKRKLKQVIKENVDLLEMRKQIILTISHDVQEAHLVIYITVPIWFRKREKRKSAKSI